MAEKSARTRLALSLVSAATLAMVAASPAQANIPPVGTEFQIKTAFEGKLVCVSSHKTDARNYALVDCDRDDANQHWKRTSNGRGIVSVTTGECLADNSISSAICKHRQPVAEAWHQGRYGRVWHQGRDSITKTFLRTSRHNTQGAVLGFQTSTNGTTPQGAGFFAFDMV
ncbi:RICIN domain-containing protein (plasmid) [Streptomyces sp. BHT-5-2]|uniref:RICIN domain-containing protein n=1 Tax=unclassified Streptomyces TaxID=2593676 RepID=UPI001C8E14D7|nr:RICIN domain-containing protein [Streptomyces sp. BHT-5-2]QZL09043.1 RICIN domain-containing protein [Streptomyces sp. BHT-5-2]